MECNYNYFELIQLRELKLNLFPDPKISFLHVPMRMLYKHTKKYFFKRFYLTTLMT